MTFSELESYAQENGFDSLKFKFINLKGEQKYGQWVDAYMGAFIIFQDDACDINREPHFTTFNRWINAGGDKLNYELF